VHARLGDIQFALASGDRFFRSHLGEELSESLNIRTASILHIQGLGIGDGGSKRVNNVQVYGIDSTFWSFWKDHPDQILSDDGAIINNRLAQRLGLKTGDEFLIRVEKVGHIPQDVPLTAEREATISFRLRVKTIASDRTLGRFSLRSNQVAPFNVFMNRTALSRSPDLSNQANMILVAGNSETTIESLQSALKENYQMEDAGLNLSEHPNMHFVELTSKRIFIDPPVAEAAMNINSHGQGILTYFVNTIQAGSRTTPYSFVSAPGEPAVPSGMQDDEIIVNQWLADDLQVKKKDRITLTYFIIGPGNQLFEKEKSFLINKIVPISGIYADRTLMPQYPGLADAGHCQDWDPGIPINLDRIRKKDEAYWDMFRGTPKAFITLSTAQTLWQNRFGSFTAIRFSDKTDQDIEQISKDILRHLNPAALGLTFYPVRSQGLQAGQEGVDFGQLFLGLSFFLVVAGLLLTSLLFVFSLENRSEEIGTLLAVGWRPTRIKRLYFLEGLFIAFIGGLLGILLSLAYNQLVQKEKGQRAGKTLWVWILFVLTLLGGLALVFGFDPQKGQETAGIFFGSGSLILISGLILLYLLLVLKLQKKGEIKMDIVRTGLKNLMRRRSRTLTTSGLLACGIFIVIGVGANRQDVLKDIGNRSSGTGGFGLYGETTVPFFNDLNDKEEKHRFGLESFDSGDLSFVPMRVQQGDDASCLNLNRVQNPRILSIDPKEMVKRKAFSFAVTDKSIDRDNAWQALDQSWTHVIPAIADQTVILWGLGKSVGDTLFYTDENGNQLGLKLIAGLKNSIFQGNVLISEKNFNKHFPSVSGYRIFLADVSRQDRLHIMERLQFHFEDRGLGLVPAEIRLAEFNQVQNTYLSIFLSLGGLGLLLGCVGLGIVVVRNLQERRAELALLRAVGWSTKQIRKYVLSEHVAMFLMGLFIGLIAAIIAVLPAIQSPDMEFPLFSIFIIVIGLFINGLVWILLAVHFTLRGELLPALRNE